MTYALRQHVAQTSPDLTDLEKLAAAERYSFVARTRQEWDTGANCFDQPGEVFYLAVDQRQVIGMCGLNRDPYVDDPAVGRLRHLYVHPHHRRSGIAAGLVAACLASAATSFERVRLRTSNPAADSLYRSLGFVGIDEPSATHEMRR